MKKIISATFLLTLFLSSLIFAPTAYASNVEESYEPIPQISKEVGMQGRGAYQPQTQYRWIAMPSTKEKFHDSGPYKVCSSTSTKGVTLTCANSTTVQNSLTTSVNMGIDYKVLMSQLGFEKTTSNSYTADSSASFTAMGKKGGKLSQRKHSDTYKMVYKQQSRRRNYESWKDTGKKSTVYGTSNFWFEASGIHVN